MITFRAGGVALATLLTLSLAACSREQQDWRSAEGADTTEAYGRFLEQHADSELAAQARARIAQLDEQRDWQHTLAIGTMDGFREFLAHHPNGRWSEEARIRIEATALGSAPRIAPPTPAEVAAAPTGVRALRLATSPVPDAKSTAVAVPAAASDGAQPGESARPAAVPSGAVAQPGEAAQPQGALFATPAAVSSGEYGIQLGAFGSPASADREWQRLQERFGPQLGGLSPRIVPASTNAGQLYRLQVAAAGEAQARAICDSLKQQSQACVPVLPR